MIVLKNKLPRKYEARTFKLVECRSNPTAFLPLNANIGGQTAPNNYVHKESK